MTARGRPITDRLSERRTRSLYSEWMEGGLDVVEALIKDAGSERVDLWPTVDSLPQAPALPPVETGIAPDPGRVADAVAKGWLVSVPGDEPICRNRPGLLTGLSVVVKDIIDVVGMPTRNGTPGALWRDPERSAEVWSLLEREGARCLGKSATHEMAWGVTTPQIPHPADAHRAPGGSSGGSAACVAAGVSPAALGTDTGGSIRIPAALCGVVGLRPTIGALPMEGVTPLAAEQDVVGPLARDVKTCAKVSEVLLGRSLAAMNRSPEGLRIGVLERVGRLNEESARAYQDALNALREAGAQIVPCDTALHRSARSVSFLTMLTSSAQEHAAAVRVDPGGFSGEARALLTLGEPLFDRVNDIQLARRVLIEGTADLFAAQDLDAFVTPTCPCPAPYRHSETVAVGSIEQPVNAALVAFTAWASATGLPAVSAPVMSSTLPVGMQVMAAPHREDVCLRVAMALNGESTSVRGS